MFALFFWLSMGGKGSKLPSFGQKSQFGPNLAVYGPKILIFVGVSKVLVPTEWKKPPRQLVRIVFWSGIGSNGPKRHDRHGLVELTYFDHPYSPNKQLLASRCCMVDVYNGYPDEREILSSEGAHRKRHCWADIKDMKRVCGVMFWCFAHF